MNVNMRHFNGVAKNYVWVKSLDGAGRVLLRKAAGAWVFGSVSE